MINKHMRRHWSFEVVQWETRSGHLSKMHIANKRAPGKTFCGHDIPTWVQFADALGLLISADELTEYACHACWFLAFSGCEERWYRNKNG